MVGAFPLLLMIGEMLGWMDRRQQHTVAYLVEESRILRKQLQGTRLTLSNDERRRLAVRGYRLGRRALRQIGTIVTPDTILRWHRRLIARKWSYATEPRERGHVLREIRRLTVRMAEENPTWDSTRIQGALKNVGHRVGRSTTARILKAHGVAPVPDRPKSWQTFLRAHWGAVAGADFLTTEVWTWRGLVTYYTVFVIDFASRRVHVVGSTPFPNGPFMSQVCRALTAPGEFLADHRMLICDRDAKWSGAVGKQLGDAGIRMIQTPFRAPNANAYVERFVRSIKQECLNRIIPFGAGHLRRTITEFVEHYHGERNHQGVDNELIDAATTVLNGGGRIRRRQRLGGLLNYYTRAA